MMPELRLILWLRIAPMGLVIVYRHDAQIVAELVAKKLSHTGIFTNCHEELL